MGETVPGENVRIGLCQLRCQDKKEENLTTALEMFQLGKEKGIQMMFFPEAFDYIAQTKEETASMSETLEGPSITKFKNWAQEFNVWISLGGFHERDEEKEKEGGGTPWVRNCHILLDPEGTVVSLYRKVHLFDVSIPGDKLQFRESSFIFPGNKLVLTPPTPIGRIGLGICYDLRFPEFSMGLRKMGADVLTFPSAFTLTTGRAHWEPLLRARAIENQTFVIAAAQAGAHTPKRHSYGHSIVIDPWGKILGEIESEVTPGFIAVDLDLTTIQKVRKEMPVMDHKIPWLNPPFSTEEGGQASFFPSQSGHVSFFKVPTDTPDTQEFSFGPFPVKYQNVFLENRGARASVNRKCVAPGHVLVISKRVVKRLKDLEEWEVADLFQLVQKVETVMEFVEGQTSSTITVQDGPDSGQTVPHIHVHVIPRRHNDFPENDTIYQELVTHDKGPDVQWRPYEEMREESMKLRGIILNHFPHFLQRACSHSSTTH